MQEKYEADYLIITTEDKKDLVLQSLQDLELYDKDPKKS